VRVGLGGRWGAWRVVGRVDGRGGGGGSCGGSGCVITANAPATAGWHHASPPWTGGAGMGRRLPQATGVP